MPNGSRLPITMSDLARRAGVSKATVSRALSGDPRVKAETRERIARLAQEVHFTPNRLAAGLARNRKYALGLFIPSPPRGFSDPFYLEFVGGVGDYAVKRGYGLFLLSGEMGVPGGNPPGMIAANSLHHVVDGLLLTEPEVADPRLGALQAMGIPVVFLGSHYPDVPGAFWVDGDNVAGAASAVRYLLELGHRRIGCLTGPPHLVATRNRVAGYLQAMTEAGLDVPSGWSVQGDFTEEGGYAAGHRLLADLDVTAVFACNDLMAIGLVRAARERGIPIPDKLSVMGFDGIRLGQLFEPRLTTVRQPIYTLGMEAAQLLIGQIEGHAAPEPRRTLQTEILVGASTGPALKEVV